MRPLLLCLPAALLCRMKHLGIDLYALPGEEDAPVLRRLSADEVVKLLGQNSGGDWLAVMNNSFAPAPIVVKSGRGFS